MIPACARKTRSGFHQQICHWPFRCHLLRENQVLPTLLNSRDTDDHHEQRKQQTQHLLILNTPVAYRRRFPGATDGDRFSVAVGLRDAKQEARFRCCLWRSSRWLASDGSNRPTQDKDEKEKLATCSVEELQVHPGVPAKLPSKQAITEKISSAIRTVASMSRQARLQSTSVIFLTLPLREDWVNKLHGWKTAFVRELHHYWVGSKLLWAEIKISTRLLTNLSAGKHLTRREQLQLRRTATDVVRLVPFIVIVIVPFMEFLLPVLLKFFPNMLPSTFQDQHKKEAELTKRLEARLQHAKLLQKAVVEMVGEVQQKQGHSDKTAQDLDEFMCKVRTGQSISNSEILGFAKLFNDELTLDNISRPRLISMCKYMGLTPYGTDAYLRYALRKRLAWIKSDDALIRNEGIDSLSDAELRFACRERGMLVSLSPKELKQQLSNWLQLSLEHNVSSSLLILSRAFVPDKMKPAEAVQATLSSLPDEVVHSVGVTVLPSDDTFEERKRKLEVLQQQEEMIQREQQKPKPGGEK